MKYPKQSPPLKEYNGLVNTNKYHIVDINKMMYYSEIPNN
jgi:hypothetical protein